MVLVKKLYRSRTNKMLSGVCGGLSELTNIDATLYRILLVVLTILSSGTLILVYIIVSMIVPKTPNIYNPYGPTNGPNNHSYGYQNPMHGHDPMNQRTSYNSTWNSARPADNTAYQAPPQSTDQMMDDLEKKALRREIDELKTKLSRIEKGE